jgi:cell division protein FtsZ
MGGGTGTGAGPVVAEVAKRLGILTVGVVTKPFDFEARKKRKYALEGMEELRQNVDALVTIPNQRLIDLSDPNDMAFDMFRKPNDVLISAVRNLSELITNKSYINVDFADVTSIVKDMGLAMFGFGSATGEGAALNAVKEALNNPLLADFTISGSKKMLLHFSGAPIPMKEFSEASSYLSDKLHEDGDIICGASKDENSDKVHALIVAEATEESFSNSKTCTTSKKVDEKDQGTIFDVKEDGPAEEIIPEIIEDVDVTMEELAPAAKKEEKVFEIDREDIVDVEDFDEELVVPEGKEYNMEDTNIPAYLRRGRVDSQVEEKVKEKEKKIHFEK